MKPTEKSEKLSVRPHDSAAAGWAACAHFAVLPRAALPCTLYQTRQRSGLAAAVQQARQEMESAERLSPASSRALSPRGFFGREPRRGEIRRTGPATVAASLLRPVQLLLLVFSLLASPAKIGPAAVLAQLSTDVEPNLSSLEEGSACNTTRYGEWYDSPYSGALLVDLVDFWIFSDAELTNGQVNYWMRDKQFRKEFEVGY